MPLQKLNLITHTLSDRYDGVSEISPKVHLLSCWNRWMRTCTFLSMMNANECSGVKITAHLLWLQLWKVAYDLQQGFDFGFVCVVLQIIFLPYLILPHAKSIFKQHILSCRAHSPRALCLFSHSDSILRERSKGFMATFPIFPQIPVWYYIPLLPVHKIDLDTEGENLQRVLTKETMAGFVALKIGNRSFSVEMPWDLMCEIASETVGDDDERSTRWG